MLHIKHLALVRCIVLNTNLFYWFCSLLPVQKLMKEPTLFLNSSKCFAMVKEILCKLTKSSNFRTLVITIIIILQVQYPWKSDINHCYTDTLCLLVLSCDGRKGKIPLLPPSQFNSSFGKA